MTNPLNDESHGFMLYAAPRLSSAVLALIAKHRDPRVAAIAAKELQRRAAAPQVMSWW